MGEAKRRGTYEERKAAAIKKRRELEEANREQEAVNREIRRKTSSKVNAYLAVALGAGMAAIDGREK